MPHSLTNETQAKLLLGRNIRTRQDLIKPDLSAKVSSGQDKMKLSIRSGIRKFKEDQTVMVLDYRNAGRSWIPAEIQYRTGPLPYTVDTGHFFGDVMQTNVVMVPVIPKLTLKFRILSRVFRQFMFRMINLPSIKMCPVVSNKTSVPTAVTKVPLQMNGDIHRDREDPRRNSALSILCGA